MQGKEANGELLWAFVFLRRDRCLRLADQKGSLTYRETMYCEIGVRGQQVISGQIATSKV